MGSGYSPRENQGHIGETLPEGHRDIGVSITRAILKFPLSMNEYLAQEYDSIIIADGTIPEPQLLHVFGRLHSKSKHMQKLAILIVLIIFNCQGEGRGRVRVHIVYLPKMAHRLHLH